MRVALLADTPVDRLEYLPKQILDALSTVDLIIHAGDFTDVQLLHELRRLHEVKAIHGNMDSRELKALLPTKEAIEMEDKRLGITPGSGGPWGVEERMRQMFESERIDVIVYGHSHRSQKKVVNDILFFNPGKAAGSFGIITFDGGVKGEIVSSR